MPVTYLRKVVGRCVPPFSLSNVQGYEVFWRFELFFMGVKATHYLLRVIYIGIL